MDKPYMRFANTIPTARSLLFKRAAEKNAQIMREKTPEEHREALRMLADLRKYPQGIEVRQETLGGVACEWMARACARRNKVIVYIHGGSWLMGDLHSARIVGMLLAERSACLVLTVEYRLAPENPFPAALEDCEAVYRELLRRGFRGGDIALFGDSAGGNLSLCLTHLLKSTGDTLPCALGLASPVVQFGQGSALWLQKPDLVFAATEEGERDIFSLYARPEQWKEPLISPIEGDLAGFPPLLIHVGGDEALAADCAAFSAKAFGQGVDAMTVIWHDMYHDFTIVGNTLKESRESLAELAVFLTKHLDFEAGGAPGSKFPLPAGRDTPQ